MRDQDKPRAHAAAILVAVPTSSGEFSGGSIGLAFAIPVNLAKTIADEIIATGSVTHAFFGLQAQPIPPAAAEGLSA